VGDLAGEGAVGQGEQDRPQHFTWGTPVFKGFGQGTIGKGMSGPASRSRTAQHADGTPDAGRGKGVYNGLDPALEEREEVGQRTPRQRGERALQKGLLPGRTVRKNVRQCTRWVSTVTSMILASSSSPKKRMMENDTS